MAIEFYETLTEKFSEMTDDELKIIKDYPLLKYVSALNRYLPHLLKNLLFIDEGTSPVFIENWSEDHTREYLDLGCKTVNTLEQYDRIMSVYLEKRGKTEKVPVDFPVAMTQVNLDVMTILKSYLSQHKFYLIRLDDPDLFAKRDFILKKIDEIDGKFLKSTASASIPNNYY